jgi:hypothetical protein
MVRGKQVMLGLGLAGFWLVWGAGPLGEPLPGMMGGRNCSRLAKSDPVAPKAETADAVGRQAPPPPMENCGPKMQPERPPLESGPAPFLSA